MTIQNLRRLTPNELVVLLVDSDDRSRARDTRIVASGGHAVRGVPSALHALHYLEQHASRVALVIAEQVMPAGLDGLRLLIQVKKRWPSIRRVICTARPRGELVVRAKTDADARTLIRPVPEHKLVAVIQEELDAYAR